MLYACSFECAHMLNLFAHETWWSVSSVSKMCRWCDNSRSSVLSTGCVRIWVATSEEGRVDGDDGSDDDGGND